MNTSKSLRIPTGMRGLCDTVPPEGIPTSHLSTIDLYFDYIAYKQPTPRGLIGFETTGSASRNSQNIPLESDLGCNKHDEILVESTGLHAEYPNPKGMSTAERMTISASKEDLRESEKNSINQISNTSYICSVPPPENPPLEKTLHTLFSSSFRNVIVGNLTGTRKKITTPANKDTKSLSQLCPSVFSLGYREVS